MTSISSDWPLLTSLSATTASRWRPGSIRTCQLSCFCLPPAASLGTSLRALVTVVGPAVQQQTESRDRVAGLGDRRGPHRQFRVVESHAGVVGAGDHDQR